MDNNLNPLEMATGNHRAFSPVNYTAWQEGYMPPSEHILIHNLMYEGARVVTSLGLEKFGLWVVVRGTLPSNKAAKIFVQMIESQLEDLVADLVEDTPPPSSVGTERPDPNGEVVGSSPAAEATSQPDPT